MCGWSSKLSAKTKSSRSQPHCFLAPLPSCTITSPNAQQPRILSSHPSNHPHLSLFTSSRHVAFLLSYFLPRHSFQNLKTVQTLKSPSSDFRFPPPPSATNLGIASINSRTARLESCHRSRYRVFRPVNRFAGSLVRYRQPFHQYLKQYKMVTYLKKSTQRYMRTYLSYLEQYSAYRI